MAMRALRRSPKPSTLKAGNKDRGMTGAIITIGWIADYIDQRGNYVGMLLSLSPDLQIVLDGEQSNCKAKPTSNAKRGAGFSNTAHDAHD